MTNRLQAKLLPLDRPALLTCIAHTFLCDGTPYEMAFACAVHVLGDDYEEHVEVADRGIERAVGALRAAQAGGPREPAFGPGSSDSEIIATAAALVAILVHNGVNVAGARYMAIHG